MNASFDSPLILNSYFFTYPHTESPWSYMTADTECQRIVFNIFPRKQGDILLNGHTHVPACEAVPLEDGTTFMYLNPGSVSIPKEDSAHSYMIVETAENRGILFEWKNIDGEGYRTWKTDLHC